jgi:hypothetical protein
MKRPGSDEQYSAFCHLKLFGVLSLKKGMHGTDGGTRSLQGVCIRLPKGLEMSGQNGRSFFTRQYPCEKCPLRPLPAFREFEKQELAFVSMFKKGELAVDKGATVLVEGAHSAHLYTVL